MGNRKDKKKNDILQAVMEAISDHPHCIRALRVAHFFHKERNAFIGLRPFLSGHNDTQVDWIKIDAGKLEAEQAVLLYMEQEKLVGDYFVMCLHTQQSKIYCSCRNDYAANEVQAPDAHALDAIFMSLARRAQLNMGEYIDAADRYMRLALKAQGQCRATLATLANIKNSPVVVARQVNSVLEGKPLSAAISDTGVKQAFVASLRVQRTKPPFGETSLNIRIPKNHLEQETPRDWVKEIRDCANSRINTKPDPGGWWHRSYVEATHAECERRS